MKVTYYPHVVSPAKVTTEWVERATEWLFEQATTTNFEIGYDTQYDRTVNQDGVPGEYIQAFIIEEVASE